MGKELVKFRKVRGKKNPTGEKIAVAIRGGFEAENAKAARVGAVELLKDELFRLGERGDEVGPPPGAVGGSEYKRLPITVGFNPGRPVGHAVVKVSELPAHERWVLAIGGRVKSSEKVGGCVVSDVEVTELGLIDILDHVDVAEQNRRLTESLDQATAGFGEIAAAVGCEEGGHIPTAVKARIGTLTAERDEARRAGGTLPVSLEKLKQLIPLTTPCAHCTVQSEGGHARHESTCPAAAVHLA